MLRLVAWDAPRTWVTGELVHLDGDALRRLNEVEREAYAYRQLIGSGSDSSTAAESGNRTVFVGYPYALPLDDYRGVFAEVTEEFGVTFVFADEELTNKHILEKIESMMTRSAFSLFDVTLWNPNVALELGIAYGQRLDYYILFDPTKGATDVLSDVRGIDRIEYHSYTELKTHLSKLMRDQFGAPQNEQQAEGPTVVAQLETLREKVPELLEREPGQPIGGIASALGVPIDLAQTLVRPLVGDQLETRGVRRGMRYYVAGQAPPEEADSDEAPESNSF